MIGTTSYHLLRDSTHQDDAAFVAQALGCACESDAYRQVMRRFRLELEAAERERQQAISYELPDDAELDEDIEEDEDENSGEAHVIDISDEDTEDIEEDIEDDEEDPGDIIEFRQLEAAADEAERPAEWRALIARVMLLLATLAPVEEVARISRGISPHADPAALVACLLTHCRRWLHNKTQRN